MFLCMCGVSSSWFPILILLQQLSCHTTYMYNVGLDLHDMCQRQDCWDLLTRGRVIWLQAVSA